MTPRFPAFSLLFTFYLLQLIPFLGIMGITALILEKERMCVHG